MHHDQAGLCFLEDVGIDPIGTRDLPVIGLVGKPLLLDAGHVEDVRVSDRFMKVRLHRDLRSHVLETFDHFIGKSETRRRSEHDLAPEHREGVGERVHRSTVLQVPEQHYPESGESVERLLHGRQVQQGLSRVLTGSIARVDYRAVRRARRQPGRPLVRVPDHDRLAVPREHANGVVEALSFAHRGGPGVGDGDTRPAEPLDRRLERESSPGGGFEESHGDDLVLQRMHHLRPLGIRDHLSGGGEQLLDLLAGKVPDGDHVAAVQRHLAWKTSPRFKPFCRPGRMPLLDLGAKSRAHCRARGSFDLPSPRFRVIRCLGSDSSGSGL